MERCRTGMRTRNQGRWRDPGEEEKVEKESEDFDNETAQRGGILRIHEEAQQSAKKGSKRHEREAGEQQREGGAARARTEKKQKKDEEQGGTKGE